jgi:hypothetical protein
MLRFSGDLIPLWLEIIKECTFPFNYQEIEILLMRSNSTKDLLISLPVLDIAVHLQHP